MRFRVVLAMALLAVLAAGPAFAAEEAPEGILELPIDRVDITEHPEITVTVTVPRDLVGLALQPADFFISENGGTRDVSVTRLPSDDLAVALVLDTSGSMRGEPLRAAKAAVRLFLDEMPAGVDVALIAFGDTAELVAPFTKDLDAVLAAMDALDAFGETALYNGVVLASNLFEVVQAPRRAIVVLSDGGDTVSGTTLVDAVDALQVAGPHFVAVELDSPENDSVVLAQMARSVGGSVAPAADSAGLADVFRDAGSDLINQYELKFKAEGGGVTQLVVAVRRGNVGAVASGIVTLPPVPVAPAEVAALVAETGAERIFVPTPTTFTVDLAWFARSEALVAAAITVFGALAIAFIVMLPSRSGALALFGLVAPKSGSRLPFSGLTQRVAELAEMALAEGWGDRRIRRLLDQAGSRLHVGEFVVLLFVVALSAFGVGFVLANLLVGLLAAVVAPAITTVTVQAAGERRARQFRAQLSDSLQLIAGSIRAGFALSIAIAAVAQEQPEPTKSEFNRIEVEVQLGRSIEDALRSAAIRTQSEDLPWVADAIDIHRETGGDIAAILDSIASSVREREQVRAEIKVLSAEGRISGLILILMPIVLAGVAYVAAPGYLDELFETSEGQVMIGVAVGAMVIGIEWIRRIVRLRF